MSLRHAAPSPPELPGSLHRLARKQLHRPYDFLFGHPYQDGKGEYRGGYRQKVDPVCGICGAHGGHETAEGRRVRRTDGGCRLRGVAGKKLDGVSPGRSKSFQYNADQ